MPEPKPSNGFACWVLTGSHCPCPGKPACLCPCCSHLCPSCAHIACSNTVPEPQRRPQSRSPAPRAWVPSQPASTLHPPSQQWGSSIAAACLLTTPPAKTSTLAACHRPDIPGMPCPSPQSPDYLPPSFMITTSSEDVNWCSAAGCPCCWAVPVDKPQEAGMVVASKERKWFLE